jgi:hypothetical protein
MEEATFRFGSFVPLAEVGAESLDYFVSERQIPRQPNSGGLCDFRVDHE